MKSIIKGDSEDRCYICGRAEWIERHHIFNGTANRKKSEKYGLTVHLCHWCHNEPPRGVHYNQDADKLKADIDRLNTIVERLDELLGKGINDYIMGIDGVEGIQDMWERSAVMEFAEKLKSKSYVNDYCREVVEIDKIDELLKEYE